MYLFDPFASTSIMGFVSVRRPPPFSIFQSSQVELIGSNGFFVVTSFVKQFEAPPTIIMSGILKVVHF